jgi:hypothetical protein
LEVKQMAMAIDFVTLMLAALVVGAMFGAWLILNPAGLDAATYVAQQQQAIRTLNITVPAMGAVTTFLIVAAAALARGDRTRLALLIAAALCFVAAGLITRFLNQPINAIVITWSPTSPPANWTALRDDWWRWHVLRLGIAVLGLGALIAAVLSHRPRGLAALNLLPRRGRKRGLPRPRLRRRCRR